METFFALFHGSVKVVSRFHQERVKFLDHEVLMETFAASALSIGGQLPRTLCVQRR